MFTPDPDFDRLRTTLLLEEPDRVPVVELHIDREVKEAYLGRPIASVQDDVDLWAKAGYDYIYLRANYEYRMVGDDYAVTQRTYAGDMQVRSWSAEQVSLVSNWEEYEAYPWPDPNSIDYSNLVEASQCLWPGMQIISGVGGIFTRVWRIMGFETFSYALADQPDLVARLFQRVGEIQLAVFQRIVQMEDIGAMWYGDDMAYSEGLLVSPKILRRHVFPYLKEMGNICQHRGLPFILHSDGNLWPIMDDIIEAGFNAIQPIEPKAMDIVELKEKVGDRLCLIGNIDLGYTLTLGTPQEVEEEVKERIRCLAPGGGYCVSSSNTVTYYVPLENFKAMIKATREYGHYPISL